jgi:hypothetical protein
VTERTAANSPKVSVVSTTYNQEAYVRQTFDGFVAQQTDFPVEVIVADDASTDATPAIIREYAERYPHLFRPIFRPENVGYKTNLIRTFAAARGKYVAWCEGDDYWIDPMKLSKQVAYLEGHPETVLCFHPVRVIWEGGVADDYVWPPAHWRLDLSVEGLLRVNFIQNNSVMYRRLPSYDDVPAADACFDWYLHVKHAIHGAIAMLPETMAVYRRHPHGMWYNLVIDPAKFWPTQGPGHAATFDAMLDLFPDDPVREEIVAWMADHVLHQIAKVPGAEARAVLQDTIAQHPRFARLALQYRWAMPTHRLRILWRKLYASTPTPGALVEVWSARLKRQTGKTMSRVKSHAGGR